jgi:hypothetical protein
MIGRDGKVWLRQRERDIDFGAMRFTGIVYANCALPLLLLPHTTGSDDRIELSNGLIFSDIGIITSVVTLVGRYGGQEVSGQFRSTHIWIFADGRWRLLMNQLTAITK